MKIKIEIDIDCNINEDTHRVLQAYFASHTSARRVRDFTIIKDEPKEVKDSPKIEEVKKSRRRGNK